LRGEALIFKDLSRSDTIGLAPKNHRILSWITVEGEVDVLLVYLLILLGSPGFNVLLVIAGVAWHDWLPASLVGQQHWRVSQALMAMVNLEGSLILAQAPPPAPALVPPNASNITATVRRYTAIAPTAPPSAVSTAPHDQPLASLTLEIQTSEPVNPQMGSLAQPGTTIETFSAEALASDLVGKHIAATVTLTGDTQRMRWIISNIRVLP
jgi:hypothetical protein